MCSLTSLSFKISFEELGFLVLKGAKYISPFFFFFLNDYALVYELFSYPEVIKMLPAILLLKFQGTAFHI